MKKLIKIVINIILISILTYSGYNIFIKMKDYKQADKIYSELKDTNKNKKDNLSNLNSDFRFWISVDNTNINYPVVQSTDNYFYLYKDFYKNKLSSGTIFMDYRNKSFEDKNLILYGHNMKNDTMFNNIEKFKDADFFNGDNKIRVIDKDKEYVYEVFSAYITDPSYDYLVTKFDNNENFNSYINHIREKSLNTSNLNVNSSDKIITLSTCSYEFDNARTVVHAKLIEII
ncbi:SrtB family sortase [Romboutsia maritimum]|uniref:SrtB family sortase n=1 Tax=Romboutsia maritimum TaxID=2020948 RepID=A0A371IPW4_9FIRM|nr:class B sortase [Romboutsia maritimum]RDY22512.1 SrtB family sortase [Romboutsia maritimum]